MGSSRRYTPTPTPVMSSGGSNPNEQMSVVNQQRNTSFGGNYGFFGNIGNIQQGQQNGGNVNNIVKALSQGTNYSPFFMRF